ncbi:hypothetical protein NLA06_04735 [Desulfomicrobium sp. ZS1]|uniref:hypothetical protein n=1 Tax=Desulfomicrobium sp. ZS1 TaxID=2952228 RepID=UPI0020B3C456|nr:hypothetical protein [Desulfomicrobium sp. ZS1]UTF51202.1 hypothetical protein NLA06_04735 [Desulfomicrobium sp. ZS1]
MIKQILICSDFLMTKESEQKSNLRWTSDLLMRPITKASGCIVKDFCSGFRGKNDIDRAKFFELSGLDFDPYKMHFFFDPKCITNLSLEYLKNSVYSAGELMIGYELSESTRTILDAAGISFIDIWLNPLRFMDDIYFSIRSNNSQINAFLAEFEPNEELFYMHADRLIVQLYKGFRRGNFHPIENSALFVGQTLNDKAIYRNGTMLTVLDFKDQFSELYKNHRHVYYSRHPFVKEGDELILSYIKSQRNASIVNTPTYELLARKEIKTVATISSSVASEAHFFYKNCQFFFEPPIQIQKKCEKRYTTVSHDLFTSYFWSKILTPLIKTEKCAPVSYDSKKDKIRDTLSFYWGYRDIDKLESLKKTISTMRGISHV